ncbi:MAG TPA: response regulator [Gammaproteobacteria bacterium]|nr:response regulator [Gammaproteobacteria bacterium]
MQAVLKLEPGSEISSRVLKKQVDLLYRNQLFAVIVTAVVMALLFAFLSLSIDWSYLQGWLLLYFAVLVLRIYFSRLYFSSKNSPAFNVRRSEWIYSSGILLSGLVWAGMTIWLFPMLDLKGQLLFIIVVMGFVAAAQGTMGFRRFPTYSYTLLLLISLAIALNISTFPNVYAVTIAIVVFMLYILRSYTIFYNYTHNMLCLQELAIDRENELLLQREKANSANMTKSAFLSRMSHELRTPLNAILGLTELQLLDQTAPLTAKQKQRIKKISDAGMHLVSIVNDVLDFSRIETGEMDIQLEVIRLDDVIRESVTMIENRASTRNITIASDPLPGDIYVKADRKRLKQIIVNLLDNAVKYNKQGGMVTIDVKKVENEYIQLSVIDTGYGIDDDSIDELFKPFSRLGAERIGIDGTGIGLSLSKQLVELMEGRIGVKCRQGEGCCFWIALPSVMPEEHDEEKRETADAGVFMASGNDRILLVEDNLVNCEVAVDMLESIGLDVDIANNGEQALELYDRNSYKLILMDCEMPVMDGFTATRKLRLKEREKQLQSVPIIALTAHAISGAREKCIASGMDDFLSKPFSMSDLTSMLRKWLESDDTESSVLNRHLSENLAYTGDLNDIEIDWGILDFDTINKLYQKQQKDNSNLLKNVINIYLDQSTDLLAGLTEAISRGDPEATRKVAHTLKSSSENVGATELAELFRAIEKTCEKESIDDSLVQETYQKYSDVKQALKDIQKFLAAS